MTRRQTFLVLSILVGVVALTTAAGLITTAIPLQASRSPIRSAATPVEQNRGSDAPRPAAPSAGAAAGSAASHGPSASSKLSLLLITIDTLRADHLGCYGDAKAETPRLDQLAAEGALAEQAIAVAPLTLPSHTSILTSLYPPRHGVRDNADFRLSEAETTLAEHLKKQGYATAAVVGSVILSSRLGLGQGFDSYDELPDQPAEAPRGSRIVHQPIVERPATDVTDAALKSLGRMREPLFLWVHYYDPHHEYAPPSPYSERFAGRLYDGEIAYTDSQVARLLDGFSKRGLVGKTLVAVTADHGEGLGGHGEDSHGLFVYDATIRVPLILRLPGVIPAGQRLRTLISSVDLVPTFLELLSLPAMPSAQGQSFAPAARGGPGRDRAPVYSESLYAARAYGWSPLTALRETGKKFIEAPEPEIYDLAHDPGELRNVASSGSTNGSKSGTQEVAAWRARLEGTVKEIGHARESAEHPMDAEQREKLASLGYLSGGAPGGSRKTGADPKRLVSVHNSVERARTLVSKGRAAEAREILNGVLRTDPGNPAALALSGTLLFSQGKSSDGLAQLVAAAHAAPGVYATQRNLANALVASGKLADAARAYRSAIAIYPFSGLDHFRLGNVFYGLKDVGGAVNEYKEAIRLGYATSEVHTALGTALDAKGDSAGAEASLKAAVAAEPTFAGGWGALGVISERAGRLPEARERYERALKVAPDLTEARLNHANVCLQLHDLTAARSDLDLLKKQDPNEPRVLFLDANLRLAAGDKEGARKALAACLARPGADPRLLQSARELLNKLDAKTR